MGQGPSAPGDGVDLTAAQRADIDGMYLRLADSNHYELLGVATSADRKTIRDAYFALSQRFHPDAFYGRPLGAWKARMEEIFREVTRAYETLSNRNLRAEYDASLGLPAAATAPATAVPAPRATQPAPVETPPPPSPRAAIAPPPRVAPAPAPPASTPQPSRVSAAATTPQPSRAPGATSISPDETGARRAVAPNLDADAARRAAREVLARRMGVPPRAPVAHPPQQAAASTPGAVTPPPGTAAKRISQRPPAPAPAATAAADASPLDPARVARLGVERATRLARMLRDADESLGRNDLLGATNALVIARALAPDDEEIAARAEEVARKYAAAQLARNLDIARDTERAGHFDRAAEAYLKAHTGRPTDASLLVRAATAMLKHGKELPRAAEVARRALQISPRSMEAHLVLAQIFLAGGLRASALATLESAQRLDPTSLVVKDLLKQCRGKP